MDVSTAVERRTSVRAYTGQEIQLDVILEVLMKAGRAPSGGNLQPWRIKVLHGARMEDFRTLMKDRLSGTPHPEGDAPEYSIYPPKLKEPYRTSRFEVGEEMYALLGILREEKPKRLEWFANNYQFFGAPAGLFVFVDRSLGPPQWSDLGMFLQTTMLLFQEQSIDTCPQECWAMYPKTVAEFCNTPEEWMLFCGMAIGIRDESHPTSKLRTKRLPMKDWLEVL
ncbi:MAG: nitroreductase [Rhizobiaceae bacterium]